MSRLWTSLDCFYNELSFEKSLIIIDVSLARFSIFLYPLTQHGNSKIKLIASKLRTYLTGEQQISSNVKLWINTVCAAYNKAKSSSHYSQASIATRRRILSRRIASAVHVAQWFIAPMRSGLQRRWRWLSVAVVPRQRSACCCVLHASGAAFAPGVAELRLC